MRSNLEAFYSFQIAFVSDFIIKKTLQQARLIKFVHQLQTILPNSIKKVLYIKIIIFMLPLFYEILICFYNL